MDDAVSSLSLNTLATAIRLSLRTMQIHFPSGENSTSLAPDEKEFGTVILETRKLSPSSPFFDRSWNIFMSFVVETASISPSALRAAEVMLASPLIRILDTSLRFCAAGSSLSSLLDFDAFFKRQMLISLSHQLIINLFFDELRSAGSCERKGKARWFSIPNCCSGRTTGEASGPDLVSIILDLQDCETYLQKPPRSYHDPLMSPLSSHHDRDTFYVQLQPTVPSHQLAYRRQFACPCHR